MDEDKLLFSTGRCSRAGCRVTGLKPLLAEPATSQWSGPDSALTALYKWRTKYDPAKESYSLRTRDWRYIRYENGKEELYETANDAHEWTNLADDPKQAKRLKSFREQLAARLPKPGTVPPQPEFKPREPAPEQDAETWKKAFFEKHPAADSNADGILSWPEYKAHKAKMDAKAAGK